MVSEYFHERFGLFYIELLVTHFPFVGLHLPNARNTASREPTGSDLRRLYYYYLTIFNIPTVLSGTDMQIRVVKYRPTS